MGTMCAKREEMKKITLNVDLQALGLIASWSPDIQTNITSSKGNSGGRHSHQELNQWQPKGNTMSWLYNPMHQSQNMPNKSLTISKIWANFIVHKNK